ncbi:MAG: hypothetical protein RLZZ342_116 [Candidatus Parcubacteria bacterium]
MTTKRTFADFKEFYEFYLGEHSNPTCRRLHFIGTSHAAALVLMAFLAWRWEPVLFALIQGYLFAWIGHFFFEHNRPATFTHPWFSFRGDWKMWWQVLAGKIEI